MTSVDITSETYRNDPTPSHWVLEENLDEVEHVKATIIMIGLLWHLFKISALL